MKYNGSLICVFILSTLLACSPTEVVTLHENGKVEEQYTIDKDSLKHGLYNRYDENGNLIEVANYEHGLLQGKKQYYFPSGGLEYESDYEDDLLHGMHRVYYETGELYIEAPYDSSEIEGLFKKYDKKGNLIEEVTFVGGEENGPFKEYYENGNLKWKGQYLNGDYEFGIIEHFNVEGELIKKMECDSMRICKTIWEKDHSVSN